MAPLIFLPAAEPPRETVVEVNQVIPLATTPESAPGVVRATGVSFGHAGEDIAVNFAAGIDYAQWEKGVTAAPRGTFADRLDFLDLD